MKTLLSRKSILSILMVLAVLSSGVFSLYAMDNISTGTLLSVETSFEWSPSQEYNENWLSEPFVVTANQQEWYREHYNNEELAVGNVYQLCNVNGTEQMVCLASGNYTKRAVAGNDLYLVSDGAVTRWNLTTLESELVYSANTPVTGIEASDGVMFFKSSSFVYRYNASTKTLEMICDVGNAANWFPISNQTICVMEANLDYWEAVTASGTSEYGKPEDPEAFSAWLNERFSLQTSSESEIMTECDVENILTACGIEKYNTYWYNAEQDKVFDSYELPQQVRASFVGSSENVDSMQSLRSTSNLIPTIWEYPTQSHFSKLEDGCECHGVTGLCSHEVDRCNCILFDGGIQCNGYARYVFYKTSTQRVSASNRIVTNWDLSDLDDSILYSNLEDYPMPIYAGVTTRTGRTHYILIYSLTSDGFDICEGNVYWTESNEPETCQVRNSQTLSFSDIFYRYDSIDQIVYPKTFHRHVNEGRAIDSSGHVFDCYDCGFQTTGVEPHTTTTSWYKNASGHWKNCMDCGYPTPIRSHYFSGGVCIVCGYTQ